MSILHRRLITYTIAALFGILILSTQSWAITYTLDNSGLPGSGQGTAELILGGRQDQYTFAGGTLDVELTSMRLVATLTSTSGGTGITIDLVFDGRTVIPPDGSPYNTVSGNDTSNYFYYTGWSGRIQANDGTFEVLVDRRGPAFQCTGANPNELDCSGWFDVIAGDTDMFTNGDFFFTITLFPTFGGGGGGGGGLFAFNEGTNGGETGGGTGGETGGGTGGDTGGGTTGGTSGGGTTGGGTTSGGTTGGGNTGGHIVVPESSSLGLLVLGIALLFLTRTIKRSGNKI